MIDTYPRTRSETRYIRAAICPTCGAPHAIYTPSDRMHAPLGHVMADGVTLGRISPRGYRAVYGDGSGGGPRRATRAEANADACARIIAGKAPRPTTVEAAS